MLEIITSLKYFLVLNIITMTAKYKILKWKL